MADRGATAPAAARSVAYLLKGYPRMSEIFIASEIERLERAGLSVRLYVIKQPDERERTVVERIRARPSYLRPWTRSRAPPSRAGCGGTPTVRPEHRTVAPSARGARRAAAAALAQAARPRVAPCLAAQGLREGAAQAVALAEPLLAAPDVRHLHAHFAHGCTTVAWLASMITGLPFRSPGTRRTSTPSG